jgi:hypothetical protein
MPLHYHNQIVKELSANSLLELAKPRIYQSAVGLSTGNKPARGIFFPARLSAFLGDHSHAGNAASGRTTDNLHYIGLQGRGNPHQKIATFSTEKPMRNTIQHNRL